MIYGGVIGVAPLLSSRSLSFGLLGKQLNRESGVWTLREGVSVMTHMNALVYQRRLKTHDVMSFLLQRPLPKKVNQISFQENAPTTKTIKFKSQKLAVMYVQLILPSGFVCVCAA